MFMHTWPMGPWGWSGIGFGFLTWALLIVGLVALIRLLGRPHHWHHRPYVNESPLDILDRRYARGELTREQYQHMRDDLRDRSRPAQG